MIIQDKKGIKYTITASEWERTIVKPGNAYKFAVLEDDAPVEVKQLRIEKQKLKEETKLKSTKKHNGD